MLTEQQIKEQFPDVYKRAIERADGHHQSSDPSWYVKRLGKVTGSRLKQIETTLYLPEDVPSRADEKRAWLKGKGVANAHTLKGQALTDEINKFKVKSLTAGAKTLLDELVSEQLVNPSCFDEEVPNWANVSSAAIRWGHEHEGEAIEAFSKQMGVEVEQKQFIQSQYPLFGLSPDGIVKGGHAAVEVKCPYKCSNHVKVLLENTYDERYEAQLLGYFLADPKIGSVFFVSYDPRMKAEYQLHIYELERSKFGAEIEKLRSDLLFFLEQYEAELKKLGLWDVD